MKVLFYGRLAEAMGREVILEVDAPCTVAALRERIGASPDFSRPGNRACVDDRIVGEDFIVAPGATVEFLPPLSGG